MIKTLFAVVSAALLFVHASAECPNACSAHGKCGAFDMCVCYRNWMANDCSERICQFNLAHVDTPKGDLDASSGKLTGPDVKVVINSDLYPYGTQEQYPEMVTTSGHVLSNTAHYYSECSNKGICDRSAGTCACFDGYSGSACQYASCPSSGGAVCSGRGTCQSIKEIAAADNNNIYKLWDEHATLGCVCDPGYEGPDCSMKSCKYGADPLYYDDFQNIRYSNWTYEFYTTAAATIKGNYSLVFYDHFGEDWHTGPIDINANCDDITNALEALPNNVIPANSVRCQQHYFDSSADDPCDNALDNDPLCDVNSKQFTGGKYTLAAENSGFMPKYTLAFPKNPGNLTQIAINKYLDGTRPTLYTDETDSSTLGWHIYSNGFLGEDDDLVPDECVGILATLSYVSGKRYHVLSLPSAQQERLLKICLGDSDGNPANNVDVYNWDHGDQSPIVNSTEYMNRGILNHYQNPHLIKLIDATQDTVKFDESLYQYPISRLCVSTTQQLNTYDLTNEFLGNEFDGSIDGYNRAGWCDNLNPPGFYAVLYYDSNSDQFRIFTRAAHDYSSSTQFHVYTTQGYLQRVSPIATAFSYSDYADTDVTKVSKYHSQTVYMSNITFSNDTTGAQAVYYGNVDCETNPTGENYATDCLNKGDYVMLLDVSQTANSLKKNSIYPNMYQVLKIGREERQSANYNSETLRHQIVLNTGVNSPYSSSEPASIYKFHPSSTKYNYVGQCSNRGICDNTVGICTCFSGYTNDNCDTQNALVM